MGLFYSIKEDKAYKVIHFTSLFIFMNYSIYALFIVSFLVFLILPILSLLPLLVAGLLAITRTIVLFSIKYINKKYIKEGSIFSFSNPLSLKVFK